MLEVVVRPARQLAVALVSQFAVQSGEGPQQACVEDETLRRVLAQRSVVVHLGDETAARVVQAALPPEREQVALQFLLDRFSELSLIHRSRLTVPEVSNCPEAFDTPGRYQGSVLPPMR